MSTNAAYLAQADEKKAFQNLKDLLLELYKNQEYNTVEEKYTRDEDLKDILYLIDVLEESVALAKEALVLDCY